MSFAIQKNIAHYPLNDFPAEIIIWGGADQARVVRPILEELGAQISLIVDDTPDIQSPFSDIELIAGDQFMHWLKGKQLHRFGYVIAIGNPYGFRRCELDEELSQLGLKPISFAAPCATIDPSAIIAPGAQIMRGALIHVDTTIGRQCIINTKAVVEHHCNLGNGIEIAPNATLCGRVNIEDYAWVCAGAVVIPRITIGHGALVGAGSIVINDVPALQTVAGNPAKSIVTQTRNVI